MAYFFSGRYSGSPLFSLGYSEEFYCKKKDLKKQLCLLKSHICSLWECVLLIWSPQVFPCHQEKLFENHKGGGIALQFQIIASTTTNHQPFDTRVHHFLLLQAAPSILWGITAFVQADLIFYKKNIVIIHVVS